MRIAKAHIENLRSLKIIDIDFNKCTIFVGKNNSGKSNVLNCGAQKRNSRLNYPLYRYNTY